MAKINHINYLDIVDTIFTGSKNKGLTHVNSDEDFFSGKNFLINGKELKNFGTCGYMGLEQHPLLVEGSVDLLRKYGTQFSMGRIFMRPKYIRELEELMGEIFLGNKVLCYTSTSTAHISVIANAVKPQDLIILDQQVHFSVQFPAKNTRLQGTTVNMVKHSDWDALESMIREEYNKYEKIWYMADGVYSMHGDFPDTDRLKILLDKYPKLNLYFDDAHGMSWSGKYGAGYIFDKLGVNNRIILISTLAKGFGCVGGTAVISDENLYHRIDIFGGPHSYSHPLTPATAGAAIASAKLHLSRDFSDYQRELFDLTTYMDAKLLEKGLPNISAPNSPIYFIAGGLNKVTHNFVRRVLNDGIYVNTATFPAVPNDRSGLRFTITRHNTKQDIDEFVDIMSYHLPKAIEEEGDDIARLLKDFDLMNLIPENFDKKNVKEDVKKELKIELYDSILEINEKEWDDIFGNESNISFSGLKCMEEIFSGNEKNEENWKFNYLILRDYCDNIRLATFFTTGIYKDDLLSNENVSAKIEKERMKNKYFLCSKTISMGSLFAESKFLYLSNSVEESYVELQILLEIIDVLKNKNEAKNLILRDFEYNKGLDDFFIKEGFIRIEMPNSNVLNTTKWHSREEFLSLIKSKNRRDNIKRYVFRFENEFEVLIKNEITDNEADLYYKMFLNVKSRNLGFNMFDYPSKITKVLSKYKEWEFIELKLKNTDKIIAAIWCYRGKDHYCPFLIGYENDYSDSHKVYHQAIYQVIKRVNELNLKKVFLGFSADFEKQKYNAVGIKKYAYLKVDSIYNMEIIENYSCN